MITIETDDGDSFLEFDDNSGIIEFVAGGGGGTERGFFNASLSQKQTRILYESMKAYYEKYWNGTDNIKEEK